LENQRELLEKDFTSKEQEYIDAVAQMEEQNEELVK
jgi:hypothetical protein